MAWALRRDAGPLADDRRPDHAAKALNDVHPDNPLAARPVACDAIALMRNRGVQRERGPAGGGDGGKRSQKLAGVAGCSKTPQLKGERSWRRLDQSGEKQIIGAEANPLLSQLRPVVLRQRVDLGPD